MIRMKPAAISAPMVKSNMVMVAILAAAGVLADAFVPVDQHYDQRSETGRRHDRPYDVQRAHSDRSQAISHAIPRIRAGIPQAMTGTATAKARTISPTFAASEVARGSGASAVISGAQIR